MDLKFSIFATLAIWPNLLAASGNAYPYLTTATVDLSNGTKNNQPETEVLKTGSNHVRRKREDKDAASFQMTLTEANNPDGKAVGDIGNLFSFTVEIDAAIFKKDKARDLIVDVYGINPKSGLGGFAICLVESSALDYEVIPYAKTGFPTVSEKVRVIWKDFYNQESNGSIIKEKDVFEVNFKAMLISVPEVTGAANGEKFFVVAAVEYGTSGELWTGQFEVAISLTTNLFSAAVQIASEPSEADGGPPAKLAIGQTLTWTFNASVTHPMTDISFVASNPLGYSDAFHIGPISFDLGEAFACSDKMYWKAYPTLSTTGFTTSKYTVEYHGLLNLATERNASDSQNFIQFTVPVTVMNSQTVMEGINRDISFGLYVGDSKLWTAIHTINIVGSAEPDPEKGNPPEKVEANLVNVGDIYQGDGVIYSIEVTVAASGWCNLDVEVEGGPEFEAASVKIISVGSVGYAPPNWAVEKKKDGVLEMAYGPVENPSAKESVVTLEVAFRTSSDIPAGGYAPNLIKVGGKIVSNVEEFNVIINENPATIGVKVADFAIDTELENELFIGGQVALDLRVTVKPGAGRKSLQLEAVPDFEITEYSMRVCRLDVYNVGRNLACVKASNSSEVVFNKTTSGRDHNDYGIYEIGQTCPIAREDQVASDNQFMANIVFELPPSDRVMNSTVKLSGGLKIDSNTIWVSSGSYDVKKAHYDGPVLVAAAEDGSEPETKPFFVSYPFVSTKDRAAGEDPFMVKETFFRKYIMKPQPQSTGQYTITIGPGPNLKVCKLVVIHIGDHFPCTKIPSQDVTVDFTETTSWSFIGGDDYEVGSAVQLKFMSLTNWGRAKLNTDLTPDKDSIQFAVFFHVENGGEEKYNLTWAVDYGGQNDTIMGVDTISLSDNELTPTSGQVINIVNYQALIGEPDEINKGAAKLLRFDFEIPKKFFGGLTVQLTNEDYDSDDAKHVDFCGMGLTRVGSNMQCLDTNIKEDSDAVVTSFLDSKNSSSNGELIYEGMKITIKNICHTPFSNVPEDSRVTIEAGIRVKNDIPLGTEIRLKATVLGTADETSRRITLTVKDSDPDLVPQASIDPKDVKMTVPKDTENGVDIEVSEKSWLPFYIQMPPDVTTDVEVSFLTPSFDNRTVLHAIDIKFGECENGKNVLCANENIDLQKNFEPLWDQTGNVTTFMAYDTATVNLGFLTNAGFTKKWGGSHNPEVDDVFSIKVQVQMSDHPLTRHGNQFEVYFATKMGDTIIVGSQIVTATRNKIKNRKEAARANIIIEEIHDLDNETVYNASDVIDFALILRHGEESRAEGFPTRIRITTPSYIHFKNNSMSSNYTQGGHNESTVEPIYSADSNVIDIEFKGGILFPDVVTLNFSLTVDPHRERVPGSGLDTSAIILQPICNQSIFDGWPDRPWVGCGRMTPIPIKSMASGECFKKIKIIKPCQVAASSQLDLESEPFFALSMSNTKAWSPAMRTGKAWREYLLFDFLAIARLSKIKVRATSFINGRKVRAPKEIILEISTTPVRFDRVIKAEVPKGGGEIALKESVETRYAKLIINAEYTNADRDPIAVNGLEFFGCMMASTVGLKCDPRITSQTVMADDRKKYRHFAVDTTPSPVKKRIVYFCDKNPYREGLRCYCSDRLSGDNKWTELPGFVAYIVGFSEKRGRMYFKDRKDRAIMSSYNCLNVDLAEALPDDILEAESVPGISSNALDLKPRVWSTDTDVMADFEGIFVDDLLVVKWQSCCDS